MPYCTVTDVKLESGSAVGTLVDADITNLIVRSDEEIASTLTMQGVTAPTSAPLLKTASICLTIAKIKRRQSHELSRTNSLSLGGDISYTVSPETEAVTLEEKAWKMVERYVATTGGIVIVSSTTGGR